MKFIFFLLLYLLLSWVASKEASWPSVLSFCFKTHFLRLLFAFFFFLVLMRLLIIQLLSLFFPLVNHFFFVIYNLNYQIFSCITVNPFSFYADCKAVRVYETWFCFLSVFWFYIIIPYQHSYITVLIIRTFSIFILSGKKW